MRFRVATLRLAAFSSLLAATLACGDATGTGVGPAFVEFLDLTDMALRISSNGITGAGGRYCLDVDPQRPNLEITTYTGVRVTNFSPKFQSGGRYTVFVTQNQSGAFQFVTTSDPGRLLLTGQPADLNIMDVTQLRGISRTAPYFHNNSAATSCADGFSESKAASMTRIAACVETWLFSSFQRSTSKVTARPAWSSLVSASSPEAIAAGAGG